MQLNILDINEFIKRKGLKEVTNSIYFNIRNIPTEDGLFSYDIFGTIGSEERKKNFAYIDLKGKFLHPLIYKILIGMGTNYNELINGTKYFRVENGELVEDPENGRTGIDFLYEAYNNLRFKETGSNRRTERIQLLGNITRDQAFIDKYIVIPAFLRDFNPNKAANGNATDVDIINDKYVRIIRSAQSLNANSFSFVNNSTKATIQRTIVEIYEMLTNSLALKTGIIHKSLLGKSVDYATRSVISAPRMKANSYKDLTIPFGSIGVPLSQICVLFKPFFIKWISDFVDLYIDEISTVEDAAGNEIKINGVKSQFRDKDIEKMLENYIKNIEGRFESIKIKDTKGNSYSVRLFRDDLKRKFTLMDLLYMAAEDIVKDKHVYVTRYPIESFGNITPCRIVIITTHETIEQKVGDKFLKNYPKIYPDFPGRQDYFVDTTVPNNSYLKAWGGDYDGDTVSLRGVFTVEANMECEKLINSKTFILNAQGKSTRELGNEAIQSLFTLTNDPRK